MRTLVTVATFVLASACTTGGPAYPADPVMSMESWANDSCACPETSCVARQANDAEYFLVPHIKAQNPTAEQKGKLREPATRGLQCLANKGLAKSKFDKLQATLEETTK